MPREILGRKIGGIGYGLLGKINPLLGFLMLIPRAGLMRRSTIPSEEQAFATLRTALSASCNLWNGREFYTTPENKSLTLLNKYYAKYPGDADQVVLNVKGATRPNLQPDGTPEFVKESGASLPGDAGRRRQN